MANSPVTLAEIHRIFEITDRLGIHRESLVIPLGRRMPGSRIEVVVDAGDFEAWLQGLEAKIRRTMD